MAKVSVTTSVSVEGGPLLAASADLEPDSYVVADVIVGPSGGAEESADIPLLPDGGEVLLFSLKATKPDGTPGTVETKLQAAGTPFPIKGGLLVANAAILADLLGAAGRSITVKNLDDSTVTVSILAALEA